MPCLASFLRCVIRGNHSTDTSENPNGGAVACVDQSTVRFVQCRFDNNSGFLTGALLAIQSHVNLQNCSFRWNRSQLSGGAMYALQGQIQMTGATFEYNAAQEQGGAVYGMQTAITLDHCDFTRNLALDEKSQGGALCLQKSVIHCASSAFTRNRAGIGGGAYIEDSNDARFQANRFLANSSVLAGGLGVSNGQNIRIDDCAFSSNYARMAAGGLYFMRGTAGMIRNSDLSGNVVIDVSGGGGGMVIEENSHAQVFQTFFQNNRMHPYFTIGGGAYVSRDSKGDFFQCVFFKNQSQMGAGVGGRKQAKALLQNCVLFGDSSMESVGIDCMEAEDEWVEQAISSAVLINCLFWNHKHPSAYPVPDDFPNILGPNQSHILSPLSSLDSLGLQNPLQGDFRLRPNSPLIDTGVGDQAVLDAQPVDGDGDGVVAWDIGAFEFQP